MANAAQLKNLTECSICLETFKSPRYLPCLHTFCVDCLHDVIIAGIDTSGTDKIEFSCPVCRKLTFPPNPHAHIDKLAEHFPVNHQVVSLIDALSADKLETVTDLETVKGTKTVKGTFGSPIPKPVQQPSTPMFISPGFGPNVPHTGFQQQRNTNFPYSTPSCPEMPPPQSNTHDQYPIHGGYSLHMEFPHAGLDEQRDLPQPFPTLPARVTNRPVNARFVSPTLPPRQPYVRPQF